MVFILVFVVVLFLILFVFKLGLKYVGSKNEARVRVLLEFGRAT